MKKIYTTLAAAALIAVSANAAGLRTVGAGHGYSQEAGMVTKVEQKSMLKADADLALNTRAAATAEQVAGCYAWQSFWMLGEANEVGYRFGSFTVEILGTKAYLTGFSGSPSNENITIEGTFDASKGTLTFLPQDCGIYNDGSDQGTMKFVPTCWNDKGDALLDAPSLVLTYENGVLNFGEKDVVQVAVYQGATRLGYMALGQANYAVRYPDKLSNTGWTNAGVATFMDAWVATAFVGVTDEDRTWSVNVQTATSNDGRKLLRVVNPYGEGAPDFIRQYNNSVIEGSIVLDITNPDCVLIPADIMTPSGFDMEGNGMFYNYNNAGLLWYQGEQDEEPYTYDELIEGLGTDAIGEMKDNVIYVYNCSFGLGTACMFSINSGWMDNATGQGIEMTCKITLDKAGVGEISAEDANAPVKYYNLQGMEVANPEAGQLVIKKQGSKTVKVIAE